MIVTEIDENNTLVVAMAIKKNDQALGIFVAYSLFKVQYYIKYERIFFGLP